MRMTKCFFDISRFHVLDVFIRECRNCCWGFFCDVTFIELFWLKRSRGEKNDWSKGKHTKFARFVANRILKVEMFKLCSGVLVRSKSRSKTQFGQKTSKFAVDVRFDPKRASSGDKNRQRVCIVCENDYSFESVMKLESVSNLNIDQGVKLKLQ